LQLMMADLPAC